MRKNTHAYTHTHTHTHTHQTLSSSRCYPSPLPPLPPRVLSSIHSILPLFPRPLLHLPLPASSNTYYLPQIQTFRDPPCTTPLHICNTHVSKEPYIFTKEPYIFAKEPSIAATSYHPTAHMSKEPCTFAKEPYISANRFLHLYRLVSSHCTFATHMCQKSPGYS